MKILVLTFLFIFTSCSSYINSLHRQIDNEERQSKRARRYRNGDQRPINNPVTLNGSLDSNSQRDMKPNNKRSYGKRRFTADDLKDNDSSGSLWAGDDSNNFLFVTNNLKRKGDIVIIEVMDKLKGMIQEELKRTFPTKTSKKKKDAGTDEKTENVADAKPAAGAKNKIHDKISSNVVEQINSDYLLVRGRKEVMFKDKKRYFEIQALVSQKDITSNDTIESSKILEPKIHVLRY